MIFLDVKDKALDEGLAQFCAAQAGVAGVEGIVREVLDQVAKKGDAALFAYTQKFDQASISKKTIRVRASELKEARAALSPADKRQVKAAMVCVKDFHKKTLPRSWKAKNAHGAVVGERFYPIERVGLYIPGGEVPLASTVVMSAVLAQLAKVPQVAVATPPGASGSIDAGLLAVLDLCGVSEIYKMGGAQAIAAFAYGTASVPAVDKVFGPGNAFVMEAKRQVYGRVGVDLLPGPSEVMIIADETANPVFVAADLLAQAEHGTGKEKVYVLCKGKRLWAKVAKELERQKKGLLHESKIDKVLQSGSLVVFFQKDEDAMRVANYVAPEHLEIQVAKAKLKAYADGITTAGAMLLGHDTPTVLGDFTAGPSHTLPTGRTGRFFSGMQVTDFLRRTSVLQYDTTSAAKAYPTVETFSRMEQLDAHGLSLSKRLEK